MHETGHSGSHAPQLMQSSFIKYANHYTSSLSAKHTGYTSCGLGHTNSVFSDTGRISKFYKSFKTKSLYSNLHDNAILAFFLSFPIFSDVFGFNHFYRKTASIELNFLRGYPQIFKVIRRIGKK
jgi:hypothetical protein